MDLFDGRQFLATILRAGKRDAANEDALSFHEPGSPNTDHEARKPFLKPGLDPPPHFLAHPV